MARLITRAELATKAGVTKAAITKAARAKLAGAVVGNRIDMDHPSVVAYLERKQSAASTSAPRDTPPGPEPDSARTLPGQNARTAPGTNGATDGPSNVRVQTHVIENVDAIADMTIREVVRRFGTVTAFKDWLDAMHRIEDIRDRRLRNERTDGTLIPREPVRVYLFGAIDAVNRRLLGDAPKTIARRLHGLVKSGSTVEDCERAVRDIIGSQIRPVKAQAARILREA